LRAKQLEAGAQLATAMNGPETGSLPWLLMIMMMMMMMMTKMPMASADAGQ